MMTDREQAIVRMHNAGLSDAEILVLLAMRRGSAATDEAPNPVPQPTPERARK